MVVAFCWRNILLYVALIHVSHMWICVSRVMRLTASYLFLSTESSFFDSEQNCLLLSPLKTMFHGYMDNCIVSSLLLLLLFSVLCSQPFTVLGEIFAYVTFFF